MDRLIEQLITVLQEIESLYERMLPIIDQEKAAALASKAEHLTAVNADKKCLIDQLARLEQQREALTQNIAKVLRLPSQKVTLASLADAVSPGRGAELRHMHDRLKKIIEKVRHSNEQCRMTITYCLRLVRNRLAFIHKWMGKLDVYGASGSLDNGRGGQGRLISGNV